MRGHSASVYGGLKEWCNRYETPSATWPGHSSLVLLETEKTNVSDTQGFHKYSKSLIVLGSDAFLVSVANLSEKRLEASHAGK